jgi:endonuclease/exonuclease/phosphatase (EEP) superfamily protein YafD
MARVLAVLQALAVAGALILFGLVGERSARVAVLVYLPRALFLLPSILIVPLLWFRGTRRWLWLQFVTALLVLGPLMGLHLGHTRGGERALRVLSWQVWYGQGDREALARAVAEHKPDIVVFEAAGENANSVLRSGRFAYYLKEDEFVVASRWPVRMVGEAETIRVAYHRPWVHFEIRAPFGPVQAFAVHTVTPRSTLELRNGGWRRTLLDGTSKVLPLLDDELGVLDEALRHAGPLAFACGDFNASDGGALLRGRFERLTDAFASTHFGYGYTFPADRKFPGWLRLDHLYAARGLIPVRSEVLRGKGSDHAGLLVDLGLGWAGVDAHSAPPIEQKKRDRP